MTSGSLCLVPVEPAQRHLSAAKPKPFMSNSAGAVEQKKSRLEDVRSHLRQTKQPPCPSRPFFNGGYGGGYLQKSPEHDQIGCLELTHL